MLFAKGWVTSRKKEHEVIQPQLFSGMIEHLTLAENFFVDSHSIPLANEESVILFVLAVNNYKNNF